MSRIVVVGAGVGGLAVAARLARLRHDVVVVEATDRIGGAIDDVAALLTLPAAARDLFLKTGPALDPGALTVVDPTLRVRFADGGTADLPAAGGPAVADALDGALGRGAGADWQRLVTRGERLWEAARTPLVETPWPATWAAFIRRHPRRAARLGGGRSLRGVVRSTVRDPRLRALVEAYAVAVGADPATAPPALAVLPYVEQQFRVWRVAGGLRRLVDDIHQRALARGAEVRTGIAATAVEVRDGRVSGVCLVDGTDLPADVVVTAVDAATVAALVPAPLRQPPAPPAAAIFTAQLAVTGRTPDAATRTWLLGADATDPTIRVTALPSDAGDAETWRLAVTVPAGTAVDVDRFADKLLDVMATRGVDLRSRARVVAARVGPPCGPARSGIGATISGLPNRSGTTGLFHVGSWTRPGPQLPFVLLGAAAVAEMVGRA